jgi:hypothetical protein
VTDAPRRDPAEPREPKAAREPKEAPAPKEDPRPRAEQRERADAGPVEDDSKEQGREKDKDKAEAKEKEQEDEQEREVDRFRGLTRDPLLEEQSADGQEDSGGGMAAASRTLRSARGSFDVGGDLHSFDRSVFHSAHIGDVHLRMDARRGSAPVRSGPVPEDELERLRRAYLEPQGYPRLRQALLARRVLVLGGAPGTGRTCTALALLEEVTLHRPTPSTSDGTEPTVTAATTGGGSERVLRIDPGTAFRDFTDSLTEDGRRHVGYLLEPASGGAAKSLPDELHLDALAVALGQCDGYAVLVVSAGSAAGPLLSGRYGLFCPPAPTEALLSARLRERLEERRDPVTGPGAGSGSQPREGMAALRIPDRDPRDPGTGETREARPAAGAAGAAGSAGSAGALDALMARAEALALDPAVRAAVGLDDLRPAEAEVLADLLADHLSGDLSHSELLDSCRTLALRQAQEWFTGVDRSDPSCPAEGQAGSSAAAGLDAARQSAALKISLAVLGGATHSMVSLAAHTLSWEFSMESDPEQPPVRRLFSDDPATELALCRAESTDGWIETAGITVPARLVNYRGGALSAAVLAELWDRHHAARAPVVRWLRQLADDARPEVWVRAALATGELCVRDFGHGHEELLRPLAGSSALRRRIFAATALDQAARHDSHRDAVRRLVRDWSHSGSAALRWTAAMALGYGRGAAGADRALDALARIGLHGDGEQLPVASFNVARLAAGSASALPVLRRLYTWTKDRRAGYQDLGLVGIVRLGLTPVEDVWDDETAADLAELQDWPLPLALAATRPRLVAPLADLMWTALNTPRSRDAALDALEYWLRSAFDEDAEDDRGEDDPAGGDPAGGGSAAGLAALLPALTAGERDRRMLGWLIGRMLADEDDPISRDHADTLWRIAVPRRSGSSSVHNKEAAHGR